MRSNEIDDGPLISASSLSAILHSNRHLSRRQYYRECAGYVVKSSYSCASAQFGLDQEIPAINYLLSHWYMLHLMKNNGTEFQFYRPGSVISPVHPYLSASPDALLRTGKIFGAYGTSISGLEIKTYTSLNSPIPKTALEIYPDNLYQCFINAICCDVDTWYLFYWKPDKPHLSVMFRIDMTARQALFEKYILPHINIFRDQVRNHDDQNGMAVKEKKNQKKKIKTFTDYDVNKFITIMTEDYIDKIDICYFLSSITHLTLTSRPMNSIFSLTSFMRGRSFSGKVLMRVKISSLHVIV